MNKQYKLGYIVKVKLLKADDDYGGVYFAPSMAEYCGKEYKVHAITYDGYNLSDISTGQVLMSKTDGHEWVFNDEMLTLVCIAVTIDERATLDLKQWCKKELESITKNK